MSRPTRPPAKTPGPPTWRDPAKPYIDRRPSVEEVRAMPSASIDEDIAAHPDLQPLPEPEAGRTANDVDQRHLQNALGHIAPTARDRGMSSMPTELMEPYHLGKVGGLQLGTGMTIQVVIRQGFRIEAVRKAVDEVAGRWSLLEKVVAAVVIVNFGWAAVCIGGGLVLFLDWLKP